jgi:predicted Zn-dependent protease
LGAVYPQSKNKSHTALVGRVALRLLEAANTSGKQRWNIVIFDTGRVNALAAVGNWFFVWRGVLAFAKSEDELAAILAHEIGHALAGHLQDGSISLNAYGAARDNSVVGGLASLLIAQLPAGIRTLFVTPERHRREYEADEIGLLLMADAGYSPLAAIRVLERYAHVAQDQKLQDSSTLSHPLTADRLAKLNSLLPSAMQRYADRIAQTEKATLRSAS